MNTLKDFAGVEFKSVGRQVVAAGSVHPETFLHYVWDETGVPLKNAPPCPAGLLTAITRPIGSPRRPAAGSTRRISLRPFLQL